MVTQYDYGDAFAKRDNESILDIIKTCNDELGTIFIVLVNKPMSVLRGINIIKSSNKWLISFK